MAIPKPIERPMRIAILLNSYRSPHIKAIRASYVKSIGAVSPESKLNFFYPAEVEDDFPDPRDCDLIIIGGGNVDPRKSLPWIAKVHDFIRNVAGVFPDKKMCGICWGHQTVARVFGGRIVEMAVPELGVKEVGLTEAGSAFFGQHPKSSLRVQQHHRREVSTVPAGFLELAHEKQVLLNNRGTILTFQGHPEKDAETAKLRLNDVHRWYGTDDEKALSRHVEAMEMEDDSKDIWRQVLMWARTSSCRL